MPLESLCKLLCLLFASLPLQLPHDPPKPLIPPFKLPTQPEPPPSDSLHDNSDWFSDLRPTSHDEEEDAADATPTQERQIPASNFRILGITLSPDMSTQVAQKFGQYHEVQRGDASSGRSQACYVSASGEHKIHLIFEQGEIDSSVYLFVDGPDWYGSDRCIPSDLVSTHLATASGLRLGMTPAQVIAILGKPSRCQIPAPFVAVTDTAPNAGTVGSDSAMTPQQALPREIPYPCGHRPATHSSETEVIYSLHVTKKLTVQERADFLRKNPALTAQDVDEGWATHDWSAGIGARFTNSRLTLLSISISETY